MKILLVEDDKFLRAVLEKKLRNEEFEVITAADGEEAFQKLVSEKPDLILLDIILPKKSGFAFLEKIKKEPLYRDIPIFIISNLGQENDIQKGKSLGAVEYFVKATISLDELVKRIKEFVQKSS